MRWNTRDMLFTITVMALALGNINQYTQRVWLEDALDDARQRQHFIYFWDEPALPPKVKLPRCADDWCDQCDGRGQVLYQGQTEECPSCLGLGYPSVG